MIIAAYNGSARLRCAVETVRRQSISDFEVASGSEMPIDIVAEVPEMSRIGREHDVRSGQRRRGSDVGLRPRSAAKREATVGDADSGRPQRICRVAFTTVANTEPAPGFISVAAHDDLSGGSHAAERNFNACGSYSVDGTARP